MDSAVERQDSSDILLELEPSLRASRKILEDNLDSLLLDILESAANATGSPSRPIRRAASELRTADLGFKFDRTNPEAVIWAQSYAGELIRDIDNETRSAIRDTIAQSFRQGIPPRETAKLIKAQLGLSTSQASALRNFATRLKDPKNNGKIIVQGGMNFRVPKNGAGVQFLDKALVKYGAQQQTKRAIVIARTETMRASNEGQRQMWLQGVEKGYLEPTSVRQWIVTPDDRLCPICAPLDKREAPLKGNFEGTSFNTPPAHPQCRCAQALSKVPGRPKPVAPESTVVEPEVVEQVGVQPAATTLREALTSEESREVYDYQYGAGINVALRDTGPYRQPALAQYEKQLRHFDNAMTKSKLAVDTEVYRGYNAAFMQLEKGMEFVDQGFVSTSANKDIAVKFAGGNTNGVLRIKVPKGTGAVDVNKELGDKSIFKTQEEFLLQRDLKFRVIGQDEEGFWLLEVI